MMKNWTGWLTIFLLLMMITAMTSGNEGHGKKAPATGGKGKKPPAKPKHNKKAHSPKLTFIETFTDTEKDYKEFEEYCNELEVDRHSFQYPMHHSVHGSSDLLLLCITLQVWGNDFVTFL